MNNKNIGFIGAGNMASALIGGLIDSGKDVTNIIASSPEKDHLDRLKKSFNIKTTHKNEEIIQLSEIVILAVKPNVVEPVLLEIKDLLLQRNPLLISIAAGIQINSLEQLLKPEYRIIRAMPNTPASIKEGVTAISPNQFVTEEDIDDAKEMFSSVGSVAEIKENNIDIYTALIGSGPAYVFYLIESLLESSASLELTDTEKITLLASMISGSANLAKNSEDSPEELRKKVTSPGGVTQSAIEEFERRGLKKIIKESMKVAEKKSIDLGNNCLLYTSPSPRDGLLSRMPSSA